MTVEMHIVWDGAPAEAARVDYFRGGTKTIDDLVSGTMHLLNTRGVFGSQNMYGIDAGALQMRVLEDVFPQEYWTTDASQVGGKDYDFALNANRVGTEFGKSGREILEFNTDGRLKTFQFVLLQIFKFAMTLQSAGLHPKVWIFSDGKGPPYP
ncbi:MAG: hypothetical protein ABSA72_04780 [Nitrososphaerales archaeon]|jgi:hypothetical protein